MHIRKCVRLAMQNLKIFCIRLAYPEKFWKLANHYFNSRKTWIPEKSLQKLEILDMQEKKSARICKVSCIRGFFLDLFII